MRSNRERALLAPLVALLAAALPLLGCSPSPNDPSATPVASKGPSMASLPTSRQQAQETVYRYYQATLRELPDGFALDNSKFGGGSGSVVACDENSPDPNNAPANYDDLRYVVAPSGTDYPALIAKVGEIWRGWGWRVSERDGFDKLNRFGYAPDGYWLTIKAAPEDPRGYPPTLGGGSPCFPGDASRYQSIPELRIITRDGPRNNQPSASPTR